MQITCPSCKKQLRVADSAAGKKVKCPSCATMFAAVDQVEELVQESPPRVPKGPPKRPVDDIEEEPARPSRRRDEEDDEDRPRRPRNRDDDDEDDDRPRRGRRRYEEDDVGRKRRKSSGGSITSVGVITIILGSLSLLCGLCLTIASFGFAGGGMPGMQGRNVLPFQAAAGILIVISVVILILGALYLVGGIGVLQRRNWGRIMTLVMAGFSALYGIFFIISAVGNMMSPVPMEMKIVPVLVALLASAIYFTHCIMSFIVLLSGQNAREFD